MNNNVTHQIANEPVQTNVDGEDGGSKNNLLTKETVCNNSQRNFNEGKDPIAIQKSD